MDPAGIASGLIAVRIADAQLAVAARLMGRGPIDPGSARKLIEAANASINRFADAVSAGIGTIVDRRT